MTISVINGGVVRKGGAFFRVLIVLAIIAQGLLVAHHAHDPLRQAQTTQQQ